MSIDPLQKQFARMGARVAVADRPSGFAVDVRRDKGGSLFDIGLDGLVSQVCALDVQPHQRHLLLVVNRRGTHKYLCGHDERDWFAAAVPEIGGISNVRAAMEALKPGEVRTAQFRLGVKRQHRNRRRNAAFVRQGEWFFLPSPELVVKPLLVWHDEPLVRGRGKPHMAEYLYRTGGRLVYVCRLHPQGVSEFAYRRLLAKDPSKKHLSWRTMRLDPMVFVRGRVRHPDHKTIHLDVWHRVLPNTENKAAAMRHLVFLD
jgi:hypothetical protein